MRRFERAFTIFGFASTVIGAARGVPSAPFQLALRETPVDSIHVRTPTASKASGPWTIEAAAVSTAMAADSLLRWLVLRGFDARVIGRQAPYRVRIGHFLSRRDAMAVARRLLRPGWTPFVTEARE